MQSINLNELNYDIIDYLDIKLLPCEIELLIRGMETYMFIFHNIYTQHNDSDEEWLRDYLAMNLYNRLMGMKNRSFTTNYDVSINCKKHANSCRKRDWNKAKKFYKKIA